MITKFNTFLNEELHGVSPVVQQVTDNIYDYMKDRPDEVTFNFYDLDNFPFPFNLLNRITVKIDDTISQTGGRYDLDYTYDTKKSNCKILLKKLRKDNLTHELLHIYQQMINLSKKDKFFTTQGLEIADSLDLKKPKFFHRIFKKDKSQREDKNMMYWFLYYTSSEEVTVRVFEVYNYLLERNKEVDLSDRKIFMEELEKNESYESYKQHYSVVGDYINLLLEQDDLNKLYQSVNKDLLKIGIEITNITRFKNLLKEIIINSKDGFETFFKKCQKLYLYFNEEGKIPPKIPMEFKHVVSSKKETKFQKVLKTIKKYLILD